MTEREKMLSGELYDSSDNELEQLRLHARKLARRYNLTDEDQQEVQALISLASLCGTNPKTQKRRSETINFPGQ